ncbi:MAG: hypothetical protein F9K29_24020 [Hyphomicrobiaceae bacterium]|nr:MAG: hypothetical protein F9K29_24020 [Hyphomicrobiaceae bacterium]
MKVTVTVDGAARLGAEASRIAAQLRAEVERELQASAASGQPLDAEARRDALERSVRRLWGATL